MTLGLFYWPAAAGDAASALGDLATMPGAERWTGRMLPSRPDPSLPDEPYRLLLARWTGDRIMPRYAAPLRGWTGESLSGDDGRARETAGGLLLNATNIGPANEDEFNDWYESEHLPRLRAVEGVHAAFRFRSDRDEPRYCTLYYLRDLGVQASPAWREAAATPWTMRIVRIRSGNLRMGFTRADGAN